jgi:hypothetical protein
MIRQYVSSAVSKLCMFRKRSQSDFASLVHPNKVPLGHFPTPTTQLKNLEREANGVSLFLKREDLSGAGLMTGLEVWILTTLRQESWNTSWRISKCGGVQSSLREGKLTPSI